MSEMNCDTTVATKAVMRDASIPTMEELVKKSRESLDTLKVDGDVC